MSRVTNGQRKLQSPRAREGVGGAPDGSSDAFGQAAETVRTRRGDNRVVDAGRRSQASENNGGLGPQVGKSWSIDALACQRFNRRPSR